MSLLWIYDIYGKIYSLRNRYELPGEKNAFAAEASVVLFSHTHLPYTGFSMAMDIMNPGTIGDCPDPTYGILTIDGFRVDTKNSPC